MDVNTNPVPRDRDVGAGEIRRNFPPALIPLPAPPLACRIPGMSSRSDGAGPDPSHEFLHNGRSFRDEPHAHLNGIDIALRAVPCATPEDEEAPWAVWSRASIRQRSVR
jgi:hypothetical protein